MPRDIYPARQTYLALSQHSEVACWQVTWHNGTIIRLTAHDADLVVSGWTGADAQLNGTYLTAAGFTATDTSTTGALNVDNMDAMGPMTSPSITEADVNAGLWDRAAIAVFNVNWRDLTMGPIWARCGWIGEITLERGVFHAELRGLTSLYNTTRIGKVTSAACRHTFGSQTVGDVPGCTIDAAALAVTGTIDSVNTDGLTLYDAARTEPGPTGGVAITGVSNANPGVVAMANGSLGLIDRQLVTISGVLGPALINVVTQARNPSGSTFQLTVDTSDTAAYPAYISGGIVDVFDGDTGFFDYGVITMTSGLNTGLSKEVKSYVPGQWTLYEPFPYDVAIGDAYSMTPGCDKTEPTCFTKYDNVINMDAEPWLAGVDKMVQTGRHNG